ncbi:hypothetical protein [Micromonospora sp. NPDC051006]|uniref:hypothetical protein n=1 Tax=Micromonospora sp. NPDC051006 TaxID=3364283 RepID=UPI0037B9E2DD
MIWRDGTYWGTADQLAAALGPDVTVHMIRNWRRRDGLTTIAGYSPLDQAAEIEAAKRHATRGRPRQLDPALVGAG